MNRFRGRLIAAALAATTLFTSAVSGAVFAAQPVEAVMSDDNAVETEADADKLSASDKIDPAEAGAEDLEQDEETSYEGTDAPETEKAETNDEKEDDEASGSFEEQENGRDTDKTNETVEDIGTDCTAMPAGEDSANADTVEIAAPAIEKEDGPAESGVTAEPAAEEGEQILNGIIDIVAMPPAEVIVADDPSGSPAFNAEERAGRYVVKIHADEGVLPGGTVVSVKELDAAEARPFADKAEQMAEEGIAVAVIDITFTDLWGEEIQPYGMVTVTFENAVEEDSAISVYHAPETDVTKMEELRTEEKGDAVSVRSDSFSPFVLLAAAAEPDWTKGGAGTQKDVSSQITITSKEGHYYPYDYGSRGYGTWGTSSYTAMLNGSQAVGNTVCLDPRRDGEVSDMTGVKVYEMDAPMLVKAFYYGAYGPEKTTVQEITGTADAGTNNIVTHVAAAEIYARLGYAYKSSEGDAFIDTTNKLKEDVKAFVNEIENKTVPNGYYAYVITYGGNKQDFGFGSFELMPHEAALRLHKGVNESDASTLNRIKANSNYSLSGARYGIYKTKGTAEELRSTTPYKSLTVDKNGNTNDCVVPPGTYYVVEIKAPAGGGYVLSNTVYTVTLLSGDDKTIEVSDNYKFVYLRIIKEPKNVPEGTAPPSLAGAEFRIYSNAKRTDEYYVGTVTTDADGKSEQLKVDAKGNNLLIQTYYVEEVRPPADYNPVGNFSIDTSAALKTDARYTLIDRTVLEPVKKAGITIYKKSANPDVTDDNECYSLAGAEFSIYSDEACTKLVETVVTDENGMAETDNQLPAADYWVRETKAPACYRINDEVFRISRDDMAASASQELTVSEPEKTDPARITIVKRASGGVKANSLAGAEFTFSYYDGYYKTEAEIPSRPKRSWTIRTKEIGGEYVARIADCVQQGTFVSGDEFYSDNQGNAVFPLGTVTITETKAPEGYLNDPDFGNGAKMLIGNVELDSDGKANFVVYQGMDPIENTVTVMETPLRPAIRTSAVDERTRSHTAYAGEGTFRIIDTVTYENLNKNTAYIMSGTLMDKATGKPFRAGERDITASTKFNTGEKTSGTVDVVFEFDCSEEDIKGHILVVKEELKADTKDPDSDKIPGAEHWNIEDGDQTIYFPEIGTTLADKTSGEHVVPAGNGVELTDTITYKNLIPGETYAVTGTLMDRATGKSLKTDGKEVTAAAEFVPEKANGSVEVSFTFSTEGLGGKALVAFEELTCSGRTIAKHEDLSDEGQTVFVPGIETDTYDSGTGKKNTLAAEDQVIVDEITYAGLIPGKTYEITGEIRIKPDDGNDSFDDAQTVPSKVVGAKGEGRISFDEQKVTFVPSGNENELVSGTISISFKVDASDLAGETIVVGETLLYNGVKIAVHRDINDDRQSDHIPDGRTIAVDTATGIKNTLAADNRVFRDTFRYENLLPGETYRFTGKVMADAGTGSEGNELIEEIPSVMTDADGKPVENGYIEFVPEKEDGTLDLYFSIDATDLENRDITVFERVTLGGIPVIIHEALDGTQTVYVPEGRTTAIDSDTRDQISMPDEEARIIDTLVYKNLLPGTEYTVKGRVMRKVTGDEIVTTLAEASFADGSSGRISVADSVVTFTPEQKDGAVELAFVFDASDLAGEDVVIFERVYHNGSEVIVHENIDDELQTIHFPDGRTIASDPDTDDRVMKAGGSIMIRDEFIYENLLPGKRYAITGKVMLKPLGEEDQQELEAQLTDTEGRAVDEYVFCPETKDGSEFICFKIDSTGLEGRSIVMFEKLEYIDPELEVRAEIVKHEEIDDEDETIRFPEGGTTATDSDTGTHTAYADEEAAIIDEVIYRNLIPGRMYTVSGMLMDKETGKPVISDGSKVSAEMQFVPEEADGSICMEFKFNASALAGKSVVAFETMYSNGKEVFVHNDLNDRDQTVDFPGVRTKAADIKDKDQEISYKGTVTIVDDVDCTKLTPGMKYFLSGILMNRSTGEAAKAGGKEITGETEFTADGKNCTIQVKFTFDSSKIREGDYVVFETLYEIDAQTGDKHIVGTHRDLNDAAQTVSRPKPPTPPDVTRTGDDNKTIIWIIALLAAVAGIAGLIRYKKKRVI